MSEWLKEHAWKACVGETLPWVRIPLSPPAFARMAHERGYGWQATAKANALSERNLAVTALTSEFEDYKHRAMDKQTKLSRELQDERNKLQAMIRNS